MTTAAHRASNSTDRANAIWEWSVAPAFAASIDRTLHKLELPALPLADDDAPSTVDGGSRQSARHQKGYDPYDSGSSANWSAAPPRRPAVA